MKKFEFKHVRMNHGIEGQLSKPHWEEKLEEILVEMGETGWDLKTLHIHSMHSHLIFGKEKS